MKRISKYLKVCFCVMAAMMLITLVPTKAQAASYRNLGIRPYTQTVKKVKAGKYYVWGEYVGKNYVLYTSKSSKAKKGTTVAKMKLLTGATTIYSNGSTIVYVTDNSPYKHTIYSVKMNGKGRVKYRTISCEGGLTIRSIVGNKIYCTGRGSKGDALWAVDMKTKKAKTEIVGYSFEEVGSRYLVTHKRSTNKVYVKTFDIKTGKVSSTKSINISVNNGDTFLPGVGKNYFYFCIEKENPDVEEGYDYVIYRCATNGKGSIQAVTTLKCASKVSLLQDKYIYYCAYEKTDDGEVKEVYYRYNLANKSSEQISESAFNKNNGRYSF